MTSLANWLRDPTQLSHMSISLDINPNFWIDSKIPPGVEGLRSTISLWNGGTSPTTPFDGTGGP